MWQFQTLRPRMCDGRRSRVWYMPLSGCIYAAGHCLYIPYRREVCVARLVWVRRCHMPWDSGRATIRLSRLFFHHHQSPICAMPRAHSHHPPAPLWAKITNYVSSPRKMTTLMSPPRTTTHSSTLASTPKYLARHAKEKRHRSRYLRLCENLCHRQERI